MPQFLHNDIAILALARSVKFTRYIKPVCLPDLNPPHLLGDYKMFEEVAITGWGSTDFKNKCK